jgi:hypothetical protein
MFIGPCIIAIVDKWKTNLMSIAILFHLLCAQHVSDINISIFRSLWLCWWITTSVILFSVSCVLELLLRLVFGGVRFAGWNLQNENHQISAATKAPTQRTENKTTDVVIHQHSPKLLKMDILMSETCWAHNKWNKIASDIKLVFHSSNENVIRFLLISLVFWWQLHYFNLDCCGNKCLFVSPAHSFYSCEAVTYLCDVLHIANYFVWKGFMSPLWWVGFILETFVVVPRGWIKRWIR